MSGGIGEEVAIGFKHSPEGDGNTVVFRVRPVHPEWDGMLAVRRARVEGHPVVGDDGVKDPAIEEVLSGRRTTPSTEIRFLD